jgi:hypothetical protein
MGMGFYKPIPFSCLGQIQPIYLIGFLIKDRDERKEAK